MSDRSSEVRSFHGGIGKEAEQERPLLGYLDVCRVGQPLQERPRTQARARRPHGEGNTARQAREQNSSAATLRQINRIGAHALPPMRAGPVPVGALPPQPPVAPCELERPPPAPRPSDPQDPWRTHRVLAGLRQRVKSSVMTRKALGLALRPHEPEHRGPRVGPAVKTPPIRAISAVRGHDHETYFFLPWFLTASIAAAAASGSR